jgi:uncharacterized protein (DUF433 family)
MITLPPSVPIQSDSDGMLRVGGTRVTLQSVIYNFRQGDTPEQIVDSFPVLKLADVYATIAYYLTHHDEIEQYIQEQETRAAAIQDENEARFPSTGLRDELIARLEARRGKRAS